jgi:U2 small nuclear ribonucleoprotein A'
MTAEEKERIRQAIENADSAEEIRRLEGLMREGWVPGAEKATKGKRA